MGAMVNVNGRITDEAQAVISVFDHGFLFGEGIYEVLRTYNGEPFLFEPHMRRLRRSAAMINLTLPLEDRQVAERFDQTMRAAGLGPAGGGEVTKALLQRFREAAQSLTTHATSR